VDVQVPIDDRCITQFLTINMSQMDINDEGGELPDSDTEGDYLPKDIEFVNQVDLTGANIQFYPGESITLPSFDMQADCDWVLEPLLQIVGSPTGVDAGLTSDGRPEFSVDVDAPAGSYTFTYSGVATSEYDDIDDADKSFTFTVQVLTDREQIVITPDCETDIFGNCLEESEEEVDECTSQDIFGNCLDEETGEDECTSTDIFGNCLDEPEDDECTNTDIFGNCLDEDTEEVACTNTDIFGNCLDEVTDEVECTNTDIFGNCLDDAEVVDDSEETCNGTYDIFGNCLEDEVVDAPEGGTNEPEEIDSDAGGVTTGQTDDGNAEVGVDLGDLDEETLENLGDIEDVTIIVDIDGGDQDFQ